MKIWSKCFQDSKMISDRVHVFTHVPEFEAVVWNDILTKICSDYDLSRPVLLSKHLNELKTFGKTVFKQTDFIDEFKYDSFVIEIIFDKNEKSQKGNAY